MLFIFLLVISDIIIMDILFKMYHVDVYIQIVIFCKLFVIIGPAVDRLAKDTADGEYLHRHSIN